MTGWQNRGADEDDPMAQETGTDAHPSGRVIVQVAREGEWTLPEPAEAVELVMRAAKQDSFKGMTDEDVRQLRRVAIDFLRVADEELFYRRVVGPAARTIAQAARLLTGE